MRRRRVEPVCCPVNDPSCTGGDDQCHDACEASGPVAFTVYGTPVPKGSTKAFMRPGRRFPVVTSDNLRTKPWQAAIAYVARLELAGRAPLEGPVSLVVRFYMPRPKSAPRRVVDHLTKPDLDKLLRCVKDGLTWAGAYRDDAQVVVVLASKEFAGGANDRAGKSGVPRVEIDLAGRVESEAQ